MHELNLQLHVQWNYRSSWKDCSQLLIIFSLFAVLKWSFVDLSEFPPANMAKDTYENNRKLCSGVFPRKQTLQFTPATTAVCDVSIHVALFTVNFSRLHHNKNLACTWGNFGLFCSFRPKLPKDQTHLANLWLLIVTNNCLVGLRMEDQRVKSPQTFLVKKFLFLQPPCDKTIGCTLSSKFWISIADLKQLPRL